MKFGIRECANVVFRAKQPMTIGKYKFKVGQPVLYIDTATTSSVEQATTTVYAQGGRGNVRLVTWEGEKTLTVTVEDALLSPISLSMLSGADLFQGSATVDKVHFHTNSNATLQIFGTGDSQYGIIDLSAGLGSTESVCGSYDAPIYVIFTDNSGDITGENVEGTVTVGTYVPSSTPGEAGTFTPATSSSVNQAIKITKPAAVGIETWAGATRTFTAGEQVVQP